MLQSAMLRLVEISDIQPMYLNIALGVYMFSYIFLVYVLVLFFSMFVDNFCTTLGFKTMLTYALRYRTRWVLISIFIGMAALPPSFFFFSKLALLSSVVNFGGWFIFMLFLGYVLFS